MRLGEIVRNDQVAPYAPQERPLLEPILPPNYDWSPIRDDIEKPRTQGFGVFYFDSVGSRNSDWWSED